MKRFYAIIAACLFAAPAAFAQTPDTTFRIFSVTAPAPIVRTDTAAGQAADGSWGAPFPMPTVSGRLVHADDGLGGRQGCEALANAPDIAGNIAFISRGTCEFGLKALNAQNAGAIGFVIYQDNRVPDDNCTDVVFMGGGVNGVSVTIPGLFIARCVAIAILPTVDSATPVQVTLEQAFIVSIEPGPMEGNHLIHVARPNPFRSSMEFGVQLRNTQDVRVEVFNAIGQRVAVLHDGPLAGGSDVHEFTLAAGQLPSGVYMYRVTGEDFVETHNVVLTR